MPAGGSVRTLQIDQVRAFLQSHLGPDVQDLEPVAHGEWSRAFVFRQTDRALVARFSAIDDDFLKDQRVQGLATRLPVPRICEIGAAFDGYFAISEGLAGAFLEERDADDMTALLPSLFATLDALRETDVSSSRGFGLWRGSDGNAPFATWHDTLLAVNEGPPSARIAGWRDALASHVESQQVFEAAYSRLARLVPSCPETSRHLVHSDLLNFNVLVQNSRVSALLDWGSSMYGDFLWDLAWMTFWQPWYTSWDTVDIRTAVRRHFARIGLEVPSFEERLRACELAIGMDGLAYQAWAAGAPENLAWTTRRLHGLLQT
jgi:hygromycin-B 4-O-kinase